MPRFLHQFFGARSTGGTYRAQPTKLTSPSTAKKPREQFWLSLPEKPPRWLAPMPGRFQLQEICREVSENAFVTSRKMFEK
jgi:hypothetical protein